MKNLDILFSKYLKNASITYSPFICSGVHIYNLKYGIMDATLQN